MSDQEDEAAAASDERLTALLDFLLERGFDAGGYKMASLVRRIRRRMECIGVDDFMAYRDHLEANPEEVGQLFSLLFIRVTSFFRDNDAWQALASQLPFVLDPRDDAPIRVWSAGCATGEEPYTLAMVLAEGLGLDALTRRVRIFATDIDEKALAHGREATYLSKSLVGMPPALAEKYFTGSGSVRMIRNELRRVVVFGRHDLAQDAPIPRVDIVSCRNALMYFNAETQEKILERLAFALTPGGILFLGKAEMILNKADLLTPVDLKHRLFTRAGSVSRTRIRSDVPLADTESLEGPDATSEIERLQNELRRAHAELLATCEELQATNEELQTFNEELRQTSTELGEKTALFSAVLGALPTGIAVLDSDLQVQKWTSRMGDLFGSGEKEVEGKRFDDPRIGIPGHITSAVRVCLARGEPGDIVLHCPMLGGKTLKCRVSVVETDSRLGRRDRGVIVQLEEVRS